MQFVVTVNAFKNICIILSFKMAVQPLEYIIDRKLPISHCTDTAENGWS